MNRKQVVELIRGHIAHSGSQYAFAKKIGISPAYLSDMLAGHRELNETILDALGLERVIVYRKKKPPTE